MFAVQPDLVAVVDARGAGVGKQKRKANFNESLSPLAQERKRGVSWLSTRFNCEEVISGL